MSETATSLIQSSGAWADSVAQKIAPELWNHPMTQVIYQLTQDAIFVQAVRDLKASPVTWKDLLLWEGLFLLVFWTLQAWRLSKTATWLQRLWVQAYMGFVFVCGCLFLVPGWLYGKPYFFAMSHMIRTIFQQF